MAYDHLLAERICQILANEKLVEKKMFGGIGFLLNGNMACGVYESNLIVRVGKDRYADLLNRPSAKQFVLTGKAMTGWLQITPDGTKDEKELADWIRTGVDYAQSLPPKE